MANEVHTFNGGGTQKLLTRSKLIRQPGNDKILACAADEATQCVSMFTSPRLGHPLRRYIENKILFDLICYILCFNHHWYTYSVAYKVIDIQSHRVVVFLAIVGSRYNLFKPVFGS